MTCRNRYLHQLIGADIAASAHPIGNLALGGDWDLEVWTGATQPSLAFPPAVTASYHSTFALSAGDLAVIGYNTDEPNSDTGVTTTDFSFTLVALSDIAAGEAIKITDRGWNSTANALTTNTFSDGLITWTTSSMIAAGSVIKIPVAGTGSGVAIGGANFPSNFTLSTPNLAPTLNLPGSAVSYAENAAATVIDATATVTDPDSADFDTGALTVQLTDGGTANDRLILLNQGNSPGEIGLDGRIINYGGARIGVFTGGVGTEPLTVTFDRATATPTAVQALMQNIAYANVSEAPAAGNRTVQFVLDDGDGGVSTGVTQTVNVAPSNDLPRLGNTVVLYDGGANTLPQTQGWTYVDLSGFVTPTVSGGATNLDTTLSSAVIAGFSRADTVLDASAGYTLSFTAQVLAESRTPTANKNNDGKDDRAGFSLLAVSSDASKAIELGFWTDRVWAQDDGVTQADPSLEPDTPPASDFRTLFTQAEFTAFDTQAAPVNYDLTVQGDIYTLSANGTVILSGELRDYTAFSGPIDPYQTPNLLSFSDNTPSAQANFNLASVSVTTTGVTPANNTIIYDEDGPNVSISGISVSDPDIGDPLTATFTLADPNAGSLTSTSGGTYTPATGEWTISGNETTVNAALAALEFDSAPNYDANTAITVSLSDGVNPTQTGGIAVNVGVTDNDNPVALNDAYLLDQDTTLNGGSVLANDSDLPVGALNENNSPLTAQLVSAPASAASFTLNSEGSFIYTPIQDFVGTDTFTYQAIDTRGGVSNPATVTLTVKNALNEFIGSSQGDTLAGTNDDDSLNGFGGTDVINGLGGNDILVGGPGRDRLTGGSGADTFVFESYLDRGDRIADFEVGADLIDLGPIFANPNYSSVTPFDDYVQLRQQGSHTEVRINPIGDASSTLRTLVTLENVDFAAAGLNANSFIL